MLAMNRTHPQHTPDTEDQDEELPVVPVPPIFNNQRDTRLADWASVASQIPHVMRKMSVQSREKQIKLSAIKRSRREANRDIQSRALV